MEKEIKIKTPDDHIIYGTLNQFDKTEKLIIFVHGLTGNQNEHHFYNSAKFFPNKGYATFRFDLYTCMDKARSLTDSTIKQHSKDLDCVVSHFKNKYDKLFLVGHSLGGPTILYSDLKPVHSIALWEPSLKLDCLDDEKYYKFDKRINKYIINFGIESLISKEMIDEWKYLDSRLVEKITKPTKIICGSKGPLKKSWKTVLPKIKPKHEFVIVKNAGHCFDEEGTEQKLFEETLLWFEKTIKPIPKKKNPVIESISEAQKDPKFMKEIDRFLD